MYAFAPDKGVSIFGKFILKQINDCRRRSLLELHRRIDFQLNVTRDKDSDHAV